MRGDVDPNKVSARQPDDDQAVEQIKANGWNNEQIHGGTRTSVTVVASQRPLPIDGAADNLPNLRIRQE